MDLEFEPDEKPMRPNERREFTDGVFRAIVAADTAARQEKTRRLREAREARETVIRSR